VAYNHEPPGYDCPFCILVGGGDRPGDGTRQEDKVYSNEAVTALLSTHWWSRNEGHVLVVPNRHIENIFDMPSELAASIHDLARRVATAFMQTYGCDGVSTRQHNGPAGNQDVWHYHLHVFPRFEGDGLYGAAKRRTTPEERLPYAQKLRAWFAEHNG
jgi:histidine triad (HIT) family protein